MQKTVVEMFAGVGGFRCGLNHIHTIEDASKPEKWETVWFSQWEPADKKIQWAHSCYVNRFGNKADLNGNFTTNDDIHSVDKSTIPNHTLLVGGFPCQNYSVASTLATSKGIEGSKGVLWWDIRDVLESKQPPFVLLENVDRLVKSPASQRGRDFGIILTCFRDLGYTVEWRVINAAEYGMPQRRRRTYIVAYRDGTRIATEAAKALLNPREWLLKGSVEAQAFDSKAEDEGCAEFDIVGQLSEVTKKFNKSGARQSPFKEVGFMVNRHVCTMDVKPVYRGPKITLGQIVVDEKDVPEEFFIGEKELVEWKYLKGPKSEERTSVDKDGNEFTYHYSEGGMAFPDALDKPSRTVITGEGGAGASRFKHVILTPSGRYRRLIPLELERLNMFPDYHTEGASDIRRAFLMGNALVTELITDMAPEIHRINLAGN